ncbi:hypothetical protein Vadar_017296 [Vaccinium darrowii]|uniref:Uncharacterized protein n=1 Tax=Vaccinium darrowii TaxID=229202 RepID=A0ACB7XSB1_9ERIC|nr:hypothetical protein Vadar_017296 [Vaccinium darrowii]
METKNKSNKLESIRKRLQFNEAWYVEPQGLSGGLASWWTSENQVMGTLKNMGTSFNGPWLYIGHFNEIASIWEKQGGRGVHSNRKEMIRERIDKALANTDWRLKFPFAHVFHEAIYGSDHAPVVLNCCVPLKKVKKVFKFESMWTTSPSCKDVISNSWSSHVQGSDMFIWCKKLKFCRKALKAWSKDAFGNNMTRLAKLKNQLYDLQLANPFPDNMKAQKLGGEIKEKETWNHLGALSSCVTPEMNDKLLSPIILVPTSIEGLFPDLVEALFSKYEPSLTRSSLDTKQQLEGDGKQSLEPPNLSRLAESARISLTPDEVEEFGPKIQKVVDWFGQLQSIDLQSIQPAVRADTEGGNLRGDLPETFENREAMISAVPNYEEPFIKVPKVLNKE